MSVDYSLCKLYTPDACAAAIVDHLAHSGELRSEHRIHEPHAGGGSFIRALERFNVHITAADLSPDEGVTVYGKPVTQQDFLAWTPDLHDRPGWIVGNPPYTGAEDHIRHALATTKRHVVFVLRLAMLEGVHRSQHLWKETPLREVIVLAPRPSFSGDGGTDNKTAYAAFWWDKQWTQPPQVAWLNWKKEKKA
jgi:hypothetical protein